MKTPDASCGTPSRAGTSRGLDDFDRPLNERGRKAARRDGARARASASVRFDLVLASPAARVRETLDGLAQEL